MYIMSSIFTSTGYWIAFLFGVILLPAAKYLIDHSFSQAKTADMSNNSRRKMEQYGLQHGVLNLVMPQQTMWMNVGYWRSQIDDPRDFPKASQALLEYVLTAAGILAPKPVSSSKKIKLLDVGFGCGDQTMYLLNPPLPLQDEGDGDQTPCLSEISSYVGITNSKMQCNFAHDRLQSMQKVDPLTKLPGRDANRAQLFCEDAAQPTRWSRKLTEALADFQQSNDPNSKTWLMGLDTLFHFAPSRLPLLQYAHDQLGASFMAFDYLLAEAPQAPTFMQGLILRLICSLTSIPYSNLITVSEYRRMLVTAGYDAESIEFHDITDDVFGPLASFLSRQDFYLRAIGKDLGGAFRFMRRIFGWWGKTGIVRGYTIVARRGNTP